MIISSARYCFHCCSLEETNKNIIHTGISRKRKRKSVTVPRVCFNKSDIHGKSNIKFNAESFSFPTLLLPWLPAPPSFNHERIPENHFICFFLMSHFSKHVFAGIIQVYPLISRIYAFISFTCAEMKKHIWESVHKAHHTSLWHQDYWLCISMG